MATQRFALAAALFLFGLSLCVGCGETSSTPPPMSDKQKLKDGKGGGPGMPNGGPKSK